MKILFIISGSIAAKKTLGILEKLSIRKVKIDCILTDSAKSIIGEKNINKLISGKVYTNSSEINNRMLHISLTRKADLIVVCPATANIIAKFSHGFANDLASTSLIASNKQVLFMPAMNVEMWDNEINKKNVQILQKAGVEFIGPDYGFLSCGEIGIGRLANTNTIIEIIINYLKKTKVLKNVKCLVTAGPTIEPVDPIRYISNNSSGKQGYEIAKQLILCGADVILISGPTNLQSPTKAKLIKVKTAKEMNDKVKKYSKIDIAIFAAAVSDIRPYKFQNTKIKKNKLNEILLKNNPDIIKNFSSKKSRNKKFIVGFAAETNNEIKNAKIKLLEKNCDLIVVNKINKNNAVFGSENNKVSIISKNKISNFRKTTKINVAKILINIIKNNYIGINKI